MGTVTDLYTTGDNDPEIEPICYYRHYVYCDACGSFQLEPLMSDNQEEVERKRRRLLILVLSVPPVGLALGLLVVGTLSSLARPMLFLALLLVVVLLVARAVLASKIEVLGLKCRRCSATYRHGTPFFTDLLANPRNLTVSEVPRPLGSSLFWRGASVESEDPAPSS